MNLTPLVIFSMRAPDAVTNLFWQLERYLKKLKADGAAESRVMQLVRSGRNRGPLAMALGAGPGSE
jgi:hypothetical protein